MEIFLSFVLVNEVDNLILSGRAIGADHHASAAVRVTPIAMSIGQGAGTLAGLAALEGAAPGNVSYERLKDVLVMNKAYLGD